jgi:hypothetical protein
MGALGVLEEAGVDAAAALDGVDAGAELAEPESFPDSAFWTMGKPRASLARFLTILLRLT